MKKIQSRLHQVLSDIGEDAYQYANTPSCPAPYETITPFAQRSFSTLSFLMNAILSFSGIGVISIQHCSSLKQNGTLTMSSITARVLEALMNTVVLIEEPVTQLQYKEGK